MSALLCKHSAVKPAGVDICRCEGVCWAEQDDEITEADGPAEDGER